jgi:uncharacterized membrane protein YcaP (DUF421 family)
MPDGAFAPRRGWDRRRHQAHELPKQDVCSLRRSAISQSLPSNDVMTQQELLDLFRFSMSPLEVAIRGTSMYWFLFAIFRFVLRRDVGAISISDMLLLVIVADASQNAMAGDYKTIADGMLLVAVIVAWNYLIDWAAFRFDKLHQLLEAPPLLLVDRGRILHRNLRQEFLNVADLMGQLRQHGIEDLRDVQRAFMESDGRISVIKVRKNDA